ncbi:hypothetical protein [Cohnella massiliensis]|uniref:hypothetical protein n=1 Tax=Cohnella massiliensis TaxID=1816691 RepID=UPI0009B98BEA|nr:hypothetical protein [Cohnella massiliensis]
MNDLLGFWTKGMVTYVHSEDEGIYFDPDGLGFIMWSNPFIATFDSFIWCMDDKGYLNLVGAKKYVYYHGGVQEIRPSEVNEPAMLIKRIRCESLDGEVIDALVFPKSCNILSERLLGFICKDIWSIDFYCDFKKLLSGGGQ